jgi:hypothetical protein
MFCNTQTQLSCLFLYPFEFDVKGGGGLSFGLNLIFKLKFDFSGQDVFQRGWRDDRKPERFRGSLPGISVKKLVSSFLILLQTKPDCVWLNFDKNLLVCSRPTLSLVGSQTFQRILDNLSGTSTPLIFPCRQC